MIRYDYCQVIAWWKLCEAGAFWWFQARNVTIEEDDLDSFLKQSFLCRPCYHAYESYSKKQMELLEALGNSEKLKDFDPQTTPVAEPDEPPLRGWDMMLHHQGQYPRNINLLHLCLYVLDYDIND